MKSYKSSWNSNSNKATYKEFFGYFEINFCTIWWFSFFEFLTRLLWGAITFSILFCFSWFECAKYTNRRGSNFVWTPKTPSMPWAFKCLVTSRFTLALFLNLLENPRPVRLGDFIMFNVQCKHYWILSLLVIKIH